MNKLQIKKSKTILLILSILILSSCGKEESNIFDTERVKKTILEEEAKTSEFWGSLVLGKEDLSIFMGEGIVEAGDGPLSLIINRDNEFYETFAACVKEGKTLWGVNMEIEWYGTSYLKIEEESGSVKAASSLAYKTNKKGFNIEDNLLETGKCLVKPMTLVMNSIAKAHKGLSSEVLVSEIKPKSANENIYILKFTSEMDTEKFGSMPVNLYYIISYKDTYLVENFFVTISDTNNSKKDSESLITIVEKKYDEIASENSSKIYNKDVADDLDTTVDKSKTDTSLEESK